MCGITGCLALADGAGPDTEWVSRAAVRIAHQFSCDAIGIQYQLGLKDMVAASDLAEGLLNNAERPPVLDPQTGQELYAGRPLPHFNEVDEGAGLDALVTNRVWTAMGLDPAHVRQSKPLPRAA